MNINAHCQIILDMNKKMEHVACTKLCGARSISKENDSLLSYFFPTSFLWFHLREEFLIYFKVYLRYVTVGSRIKEEYLRWFPTRCFKVLKASSLFLLYEIIIDGFIKIIEKYYNDRAKIEKLEGSTNEHISDGEKTHGNNWVILVQLKRFREERPV